MTPLGLAGGEEGARLRRDRGLPFYGAEDLTPSDFDSGDDAEQARTAARRVVEVLEPHVAGENEKGAESSRTP